MKILLFRWLFPAVTGLLLAMALPPFNQLQLGWIALVPLFFALQNCPPGEAFRRGYIAGLVFFGMTTWWIIHVSLPGVIGLIAFLALYFGLSALFVATVLRLAGPNENDSVLRNLFVAFVGAAGWVTIEWIRGHFPLGGFGWNGLGVTQHSAVPLIQFASFTGVYGLTALVFVLNYVLFCTIRRFAGNLRRAKPVRRLSWEFYVAMSLVALAIMHGLGQMREQRQAVGVRPLRFALIQGNIPQSLKFEQSEKAMILDRYRSLTEEALWQPADLIVWPETATPDALRYDPETFAVVTGLAVQAKSYLLTGTVDYRPHSNPPEAYNGAMLIRPDGTLDANAIYWKTHLVPFGEYVPLRHILPVLKHLTPIPDSFENGRDYTLFNVNGLNFGAVICFEDTLPGVYRQFIRRGVDFMVNLTNDAWFKDSPAAEIHLANAIFRTVETRRWLVRATNNGVTCAIDPTGAVHARIPPFQPGYRSFVLTLPEKMPVTFYTRYGDVFVLGCALVAVGALLGGLRFRATALGERSREPGGAEAPPSERLSS